MRSVFLAVAGLLFSFQAAAQVTMHGAVQFPDEHVFTRALVRFQELVDKYSGQKTNWVLHKNSELGLEKQYFEYMAQGKAVDYGIVSPAHMSTFSKAAPFIDAPFLFRDLNHWNKVLDADLLKPVAEEINQKAEVMLIGYAGVEQMKFYEVAPQLSMTQHAITIRPICFSTKTFNKLDKNMQQAIIKAGKEAGAYGRKLESSEDEQKLVALEKAGKLTRVKFTDRAQMKKLADPVMADYAKEIGADQIYAKINAIK